MATYPRLHFGRKIPRVHITVLRSCRHYHFFRLCYSEELVTKEVSSSEDNADDEDEDVG